MSPRAGRPKSIPWWRSDTNDKSGVMNFLRTIWRGVRSLGQKRALKLEIDEELRSHIEQCTAENVAAGMSRDEAARDARKRFGNVQSVREECRSVRGASFGEALVQD